MTKRKSISKKTRFEVFKRDDFACRYCGQKPPAVVLQIDHIVAVANGGGNDEANLVTSCFDCNNGKSSRELSIRPDDLSVRTALMKERAAQTAEYERVLRERKHGLDDAIARVAAIYENAFPEWTLSGTARASVRQFLEKLPSVEVEEAMELAIGRVGENAVFKYFCGICWRKIRGS